METLNKSFQVLLEHIGSNNEATESIKVLASVTDILKSPSIPQTSFKKLFLLLRSRMLPLYRITLEYALRYAAAILTAISEVKAKDTERRECWETAQESLLSGILDYLEQHQTNENQTLIASIFYSHLCCEFFSQHDEPIVNGQDSLLCTVFQLLSESVISHPVNQHKLRDSNMLGGKRLGLMLIQCKDFLAMEALLELFGNIIPSTKNPGRRAKFIQEVFDPARFECSAEIMQLLERIQSTGWDTASTRISDALAKSDASYPQPFETTQIRTPDASYTVSRIYIDKDAFVASVDEDGQLETFKLPFRSVKRIQVSVPSAFMVTVTVSVASSPLLGHSPIIRSKADDMSISFDLRKEKITNFVVILRKRGLKCAKTPIHGKMSKAESHVELAFELGNNNDPPSLEEKIESLTTLWKSNKLPEDTDHNATTSPLRAFTDAVTKEAGRGDGRTRAMRSRSLKTQNSSKLQTKKSVVRKNQHDAIFGASDEELSEISDVEANEMDNAVLSVKARPTDYNETRGGSINFDRDGSKNTSTKTGPAQDYSLDVDKVVHDANSFDANAKLTSNELNCASPTRSSPETRLTPPRCGKRNRVLSSETNTDSKTMASRSFFDEGTQNTGDATTTVHVSINDDSATARCAESRKQNHIGLDLQSAKKVVVATELNTRELAFDDTLRHRDFVKNDGIHISPIPIDEGGYLDSVGNNGVEHDHYYELLTAIDTTKVPSDQKDKAKSSKLARPEKTTSADRNNTCVVIDLTADDLTNMVSVPKPRPKVEFRLPKKDLDNYVTSMHKTSEGAELVAGAERPKDEAKLSEKAHVVADVIKMEKEDILQTPYEFEIPEEIMTIDAARSPSHDTFAPQASVSFTLPPLMNENRHVLTGNERMRFVSVKSPQKRRRIDTSVKSQTQYHSSRRYQQGAKNYPRRLKSDTCSIPRIIEVIDQIHEIVIDNTARRFDNIRKDIHLTQVNILEGTREDLREMQRESIHNYNELVTLLKEYTTHEQKMVHALGKLVDSETDIIQGIKGIIHQHDKFSLSSKFPRTVLPPIPAHFNTRLAM